MGTHALQQEGYKLHWSHADRPPDWGKPWKLCKAAADPISPLRSIRNDRCAIVLCSQYTTRGRDLTYLMNL